MMVMDPEGAVEQTAPQPLLGEHEIGLRELLPERVDIKVEGRDRPLQMWVTRNGRFPAGVAGELEDAREEYQRGRVRDWGDGPPPPDFVEAVRDLMREWENTPAEAVFDLSPHMHILKQALRAVDETPRYKPANRRWEAYVTRALMALIPGLEEHQAEMLPGTKRMGWLFDSGYFTRRSQDEPPEPTGPNPEAPVAITGPEHGRGSQGSTE